MVSARGHGARSVIFDARICYSHCTDDYRGSGTKNVIFSNRPNFISECSNLL